VADPDVRGQFPLEGVPLWPEGEPEVEDRFHAGRDLVLVEHPAGVGDLVLAGGERPGPVPQPGVLADLVEDLGLEVVQHGGNPFPFGLSV
jgi:hypothetical protein